MGMSVVVWAFMEKNFVCKKIKNPPQMPTKDIIRDFYALFLFASAGLIAFIVTVAIDNDGWATKAYYMLLVLIGGLTCHTMVLSVHAIYRDTEDTAHSIAAV